MSNRQICPVFRQPGANSTTSSSSGARRVSAQSSATSTAPTNPTRRARKARESSELSAIQDYIRALSRNDIGILPSVDKDGFVYTTKGTGWASTKNRHTYAGADLSKYLHSTFPNRPVYISPHPRIRALQCKGVAATHWTADTKKLALRQFEVPEGLRIIICWPDVFDRKLLERYPQYKTAAKGIKTPCPRCGTNVHVEQNRYTTHELTCRTSLQASGMQDIVIGPWMECYNVEAGCAKKETKKRKKTKKGIATLVEKEEILPSKFTTYTGDAWKKYPPEVKQRYERYINRIDDGGCAYVSPGLCNRILHEGSNFSEFEDTLEQAYGLLKTNCSNGYYEFVAEEKLKASTSTSNSLSGAYDADSDKWPAFDEEKLDTCLRPMKANTIQNVFWKVFNAVEDYLLRDLFSRLPGEMLKWDGTFAMMKRTMDDPLTEEESDACVKILNTWGHVLSYAFAAGEGDNVVQKLLYFIRLRAIRHGGIEELKKTVFAYTDTCCKELEKPEDDWLPHFFPGCKRAPGKDCYHGVTGYLSGFEGSPHPLHDVHSALTWKTLMLWEEESLEANLEMFMKHEGEGIRVTELAKEEMMKIKRYRDGTYNYINPDVQAVRSGVIDAYNHVKAKDLEMEQDAEEEARDLGKASSYRRYVKSTIPGARRGSEIHLKLFLDHIKKGCYTDPLPPREMSYNASGRAPTDGKPRGLKRKRGTNSAEAANKRSRIATVDHVTRQSTDLTHARMLIWATDHNRNVDKQVEHVTGIKPKPQDWYIREAIQNEMSPHIDGKVYPNDSYFPPFDREKHLEPVGKYFNRYEEWERVNAEIDALLRAESEEAADRSSALSIDHSLAGEPRGKSDDDTGSIGKLPESGLGGEELVDDLSEAASCDEPPPAKEAASESEAAVPCSESVAGKQIQGVSTACASTAELSTESAVGNNVQSAPSTSAESVASKLSDVSAAAAGVHWGAQTWNRKLGGVPSVTAANYYHSGKLSHFQESALSACYNTVRRVHGDSLPPQILYQKVADTYNTCHINLWQYDGYGHGGKIRSKGVESFFKDKGRQLLGASIGSRPAPHIVPSASHAASRVHCMAPVPNVAYSCLPNPRIEKVPTKADVDAMSWRDAQRLCKKLGLPLSYPKKALCKHYKLGHM